MPSLRKSPYVQFNFLVSLGTGKTDGPEAGFQECSSIGFAVAAAESRESEGASVGKINPVHKATDVTLKRGIISSPHLQQWLNDIGSGGQNALRTVTIQLQNENQTAIVQRWKLSRARIIKHTSGPLNAKGTDVAIEELTLSCERLQIE
jgi:phage tail-like protein